MSPWVKSFFSDAFVVYDLLACFPNQRQALPNKSKTYSVEADTAELRHHLVRLGRKPRDLSHSPTPLVLGQTGIAVSFTNESSLHIQPIC